MEEEVYIGLLNRDEAVYQRLIQQYSKLLWAVASTVITSKNGSAVMDIEEVVSDTFVRLWQHPEKYQPEKGSLKSYLAVIARSLALNKVKKNQKKMIQLEEAEEPASELRMSREEEWQALYDAIRTLDEPTREIMIRRYFYEEKPQTIRDVMRLPAKEVDNCLYRGKKRLKRLLEEENFLKEVAEYGN
ncbi:RNA polymerase sigma factor [Enterococcus sp. LJL128]|uniref:RNA polymerase sigma factor n=1 Tax=Enterococcus sp. LJL51 TaxID=3416656 RepID=UPI003CE960EA